MRPPHLFEIQENNHYSNNALVKWRRFPRGHCRVRIRPLLRPVGSTGSNPYVDPTKFWHRRKQQASSEIFATVNTLHPTLHNDVKSLPPAAISELTEKCVGGCRGSAPCPTEELNYSAPQATSWILGRKEEKKRVGRKESEKAERKGRESRMKGRKGQGNGTRTSLENRRLC